MKLNLDRAIIVTDPNTLSSSLQIFDLERMIDVDLKIIYLNDVGLKKAYLKYVRPRLKEFGITENDIEIDYVNNFYINFKSEEDFIYFKMKYL